MKKLFLIIVAGFLCLQATAQNASEDFYKKGEFMIGISPGYQSRMVNYGSGYLSVENVFSNKLQVGYFLLDNWQIGAKVRANLSFYEGSVELNIPNAAIYSRYYVGKGAWRGFFELEGGIDKAFLLDPGDNSVHPFNDPYAQIGYGLAFRPGKGRMSLEVSSPLLRVSMHRASLFKTQINLGINFHF